MVKPLHIPKSKRFKGVKVVCYNCNTTLAGDICNETGEPMTTCKHSDQQRYKLVFHVSGTKRGRITKTLDTRDFSEAIKQAIEFEQEIKAGLVQQNRSRKTTGQGQEREQKNKIPELLIEALARYIGYLNNEGAAPQHIHVRTKQYLRNVEGAMKALAVYVKKSGRPLNTFRVDQINDDLVGHIWQDLKDSGYAGVTVNKRLGYYESFVRWYKREYGVAIKNCFERVRVPSTPSDSLLMPPDEFKALLDRITPENRYSESEPGRDFFRVWLVDALRLAWETGRRREEFSRMKYSDIRFDEQGVGIIIVPDYKVNRIQNRVGKDEKFNLVPITNSLYELLLELGLKQYKDTDKYIIAPDEEIDRTHVMPDILTRSFSFYYKQLGTGKQLTLKSIRKSFITAVSLYIGADAKMVTGHAKEQTIEKHYLDQQFKKKPIVRQVAKGFDVTRTLERHTALEQAHAPSSPKQLNQNLEL